MSVEDTPPVVAAWLRRLEAGILSRQYGGTGRNKPLSSKCIDEGACVDVTGEKTQIKLSDRAATNKFARALADAIEDRAVIALVGPMGAGKTTLVQDVAAALGVKELVNSPTFTMLNEYHSGRLPLYHLDLYRLSEQDAAGAADLLLTELDEFIHSSMVAMVEWADLLPLFQRTSSTVSSPDYQLDYLVVSLTPGPFGESIGPAGESGVLPAAATSPEQNDINKDEEVRYADLRSFGPDSNALVARLRSTVAAMLIYS